MLHCPIYTLSIKNIHKNRSNVDSDGNVHAQRLQTNAFRLSWVKNVSYSLSGQRASIAHVITVC